MASVGAVPPGAPASDDAAAGGAEARSGGRLLGAPAGASALSAQELLTPDGDASPTVPGTAVEDLDLGPTLLRTLAVLALVVGLAYLVLNVGLRRLLGVAAGATTRASAVALLDRVPLDQKHTLFVVRAGDEVLLVGGAEGSLALLTKLDPAVLERARRSSTPASVVLSPLVQGLLGRRRHAEPSRAASVASSTAAGETLSPSAAAAAAAAPPVAAAPVAASGGDPHPS